MCSPVSHTHPTKLMFTVGALHVVTSSILLYTDITLRTVLEYTDITLRTVLEYTDITLRTVLE